MPFCPKCGNQVEAGAKFCMFCGEKLDPVEPESPTPETYQNTTDDSNNSTSVTKKKRGRPRKVQPEENTNVQATESAPKKRGRPKKVNPAISTQTTPLEANESIKENDGFVDYAKDFSAEDLGIDDIPENERFDTEASIRKNYPDDIDYDALTARALAGDESAYQEMMGAQKDIFRMIRAKYPKIAQDEVEQIVLDAYSTSFNHLSEIEKFKGFVIRVADNMAKNYVGSACFRTNSNFSALDQEDKDLYYDPGDAHVMSMPEYVDNQQNNINIVTNVLESLPQEQAEVLMLRMNGMPFEEIAKHQNISIPTAKSRYKYGKENAKGKLSQLIADGRMSLPTYAIAPLPLFYAMYKSMICSGIKPSTIALKAGIDKTVASMCDTTELAKEVGSYFVMDSASVTETIATTSSEIAEAINTMGTRPESATGIEEISDIGVAKPDIEPIKPDVEAITPLTSDSPYLEAMTSSALEDTVTSTTTSAVNHSTVAAATTTAATVAETAAKGLGVAKIIGIIAGVSAVGVGAVAIAKPEVFDDIFGKSNNETVTTVAPVTTTTPEVIETVLPTTVDSVQAVFDYLENGMPITIVDPSDITVGLPDSTRMRTGIFVYLNGFAVSTNEIARDDIYDEVINRLVVREKFGDETGATNILQDISWNGTTGSRDDLSISFNDPTSAYDTALNSGSGFVNITVNDKKSGAVENVTLKIDNPNFVTGSASGSSQNQQTKPADLRADRTVENLVTGVTDGHDMANTSGTLEGEQKIEADPNLNYEGDLGLQKDSELPEQEVTVVEKPSNSNNSGQSNSSQTVSTPNPTQAPASTPSQDNTSTPASTPETQTPPDPSNVSGTVEGDDKIEADPNLDCEGDLGLQAGSKLPEQEVTVVEKPKN